LLEVSAKFRRALPCFAGGPRAARRREGLAEPEVDVALVGERVSGLAEVVRGLQSGLEACDRAGIIGLRKALPAQHESAADMLSERKALPAFPGLKLARGQQVPRFAGLSGLVEKRAELDREIIPPSHEVRISEEFAETFGGAAGETNPHKSKTISNKNLPSRSGFRAIRHLPDHRALSAGVAAASPSKAARMSSEIYRQDHRPDP